MLIVGLAVPVTASFIIAAVIIAPALVALGVEEFVAYMFIFYYAVLSEVSPPTALSAFAAAAITGGDGFRTMMLLMRYTAPAFLVPFAFVLTQNGQGLLLQGGLDTVLLAVGGLGGGGVRRSAWRWAAGCAGPCGCPCACWPAPARWSCSTSSRSGSRSASACWSSRS